jgi:hypothetical protein
MRLTQTCTRAGKRGPFRRVQRRHRRGDEREQALHELLLKISGKDLPPKHGLAKPGEQLRNSVDPALARSVMNWRRKEVDIGDGLKQTLRFFDAL